MSDKARILLVDDEVDSLVPLAKLLGLSGYDVSTADGVASARKAVESGKFDLLLCDIGLQDGDGCDLMKELRPAYGLHGIAVTGFGDPDEVQRFKDAGFDRHLLKPIVFESLRSAIQETLSLR